ncbi:MAG: cytochrome c [Pleurocapsa minor GSE-CHR-MK-17-07R]|nr:cytochrome c [Pleurocapsa minor GSE-CHR-MK 17-07R]
MAHWAMGFVIVLLLSGCAASPSVSAAQAGDAERGAQLFAQGRDEAPPCVNCHRVVGGQVGFTIGPGLAGIAERAETRIPGISAQEYLRQSIIEPQRFVVSGYRNIMYPDYSTHLMEQDILDLIAYLLTL